MIFGNPGMYDENGHFDNFAIHAEKYFLPEENYFASVNLVLDMEYFPRHIASNIPRVFKSELDISNQLFHKENHILFDMDTKKLANKLMANLYNLEEFNSNEYFWDLDATEYSDRGYYPFIINKQGLSKIIIVVRKENLKNIEVYSTTISTLKLREIVSQTHTFLSNN